MTTKGFCHFKRMACWVLRHFSNSDGILPNTAMCVCVYYTLLCYVYMNIYSICCTISCARLVALWELAWNKHSENISEECDSKHFVTQRTIMCVNRSISILHHVPHSGLMAKDPLWCRIFFHLAANWTGHLSHSVSVLTLSLLGCQSRQEIQNA